MDFEKSKEKEAVHYIYPATTGIERDYNVCMYIYMLGEERGAIGDARKYRQNTWKTTKCSGVKT